jgi:hypothetical protein
VEWIIGIYVAIGVFKGLGKVADSNPVNKPLWMATESNPLVWSLYFCLYVLVWPLIK